MGKGEKCETKIATFPLAPRQSVLERNTLIMIKLVMDCDTSKGGYSFHVTAFVR